MGGEKKKNKKERRKQQTDLNITDSTLAYLQEESFG